MKATEHRHVPKGVLKPDTSVLSKIMTDRGLSPRQVVYVGDSLMKDAAMAQRTGAHDVHAQYGVVQNRAEYELLRRVSHWTDEDIQQEKAISAGRDLQANYTLAKTFRSSCSTLISGRRSWKRRTSPTTLRCGRRQWRYSSTSTTLSGASGDWP
ncbi:HAD hydrolase-like protein [Streptomyces gardneri]|nr:HAD hydrolase-like protein [Streptomyces gardneri]